MKILFAASECVPFIKTGGLADVVGALSPVLAQKGVDVRVMVPLYASIPEKWTSQMKSECEFEVELGWRRQYCGVKVAKGAVVKNSIVMQDAQIQEGAEIDHCILDKQSVIRRNGRLIAPAAYPIVIAKNVVI